MEKALKLMGSFFLWPIENCFSNKNKMPLSILIFSLIDADMNNLLL